jgi:hypothetical protein
MSWGTQYTIHLYFPDHNYPELFFYSEFIKQFDSSVKEACNRHGEKIVIPVSFRLL